MTNKSKKILVVDDDPDIHLLLQAHLSSAGYEVVFANDGLSCLARVRRDLPQLVILDIGLPAGDGESTLRTLRSMRTMEELPVVILSGRDPLEWGALMLQLGANDYLQKPFDAPQLLELVRTLTGDSIELPAALPAPLENLPADPAAGASVDCPHCGGHLVLHAAVTASPPTGEGRD